MAALAICRFELLSYVVREVFLITVRVGGVLRLYIFGIFGYGGRALTTFSERLILF